MKAGQVQESSDAAQGAEAEEASPDEEEAAAGDGGDHEQCRAVIPQSETTKFKCQNFEIIFHYIFFSSCNRIKNIILSLDLTLYHSSCLYDCYDMDTDIIWTQGCGLVAP